MQPKLVKADTQGKINTPRSNVSVREISHSTSEESLAGAAERTVSKDERKRPGRCAGMHRATVRKQKRHCHEAPKKKKIQIQKASLM